MTVEFNMEIAVRNIIACRRRAKPQDVAAGIAWYAEAYEECRQLPAENMTYAFTLWSAVVAAQPNNRWSTNVTNARDLIHAFVNNADMDSVSVCTYGNMKAQGMEHIPCENCQCVDIMCEGDTKLNGRKIVCFYENIMGEDTCTIDGHARNIAYNERVNLTDNKTNIGVKEYANLQEAYRQAAKRCTVNGRKFKAYELQAVTWVTWRKQHGIA